MGDVADREALGGSHACAGAHTQVRHTGSLDTQRRSVNTHTCTTPGPRLKTLNAPGRTMF